MTGTLTSRAHSTGSFPWNWTTSRFSSSMVESRYARVGFWKTPTKSGRRGWLASRLDWKANQSDEGSAGEGAEA